MHPPPPNTTLFSQQPYSSESFFSIFPQPTIHSLQSDSPLHTHGSNPLLSPACSTLLPSAYGCQSIDSLDSNSDSQNCIVKQTYEAAAKASLGTSAVSANFPSTWDDIWVSQCLPSLTPGMLSMPNQTKANEPMKCNNPTNTIVPGASHASIKSQLSRIGGQDSLGAVRKELEFKKQKGGAAVDSVRVCKICNVACNSQDVYNRHLSGKKHAAQISLISDNGIGPYHAAFKPHGIGHWKKVPKKVKFTKPAWCELCKISCTSRDTYLTHIAGKKHLRNLELLSKSNNDLQLEINPVIGPQEKPNTCKDEGIISHMPNKAAMEDDIEAKIHKLVEGGAAESDIRICTLCNVVCNSQTVFYFHLTGQKHAAMVKLKQEQAGSDHIESSIQNISHLLQELFVS